MSGIDMYEREGYFSGPKGLLSEVGEDDAVFAAGKEDCGVLELGVYLPNDEDGFGFEFLEVFEVVFHFGYLRMAVWI
jgi:hypothetical protein